MVHSLVYFDRDGVNAGFKGGFRWGKSGSKRTVGFGKAFEGCFVESVGEF